jgi:L-ascorbate metabolism protein UlaG (beta-lactamase superfamily)
LKITYYGHSCFGIEVGGKHLLFDPYITPNKLASAIDIKKIKADYILVSHGHDDHIHDVISIAQNTGATVIACHELANWFLKNGVKTKHSMNAGGSFMFDFGKVKCVAALHSSSLPDGSYGGIPVGFLLETGEGNFYYAGDTALTYDMKLIGDYKSIDFAFLPIGGNFTMNVDNAIIAADFVKCNKIIGMHYDTFSSIIVDKKEATSKFSRAGNELILMEIGETIVHQ